MMLRLCKQYRCVINQIIYSHDGVNAVQVNALAEAFICTHADVHLVGHALAVTQPGNMGSA